jgi:hypothetical protein
MIRRWSKFIKESGLIGNLIASAIISSLSIIVPYLSYYYLSLNKKITFSLSISTLVSLAFLIIGIFSFIYFLLTNTIRKVGQFKGYYRKYLNVNFYPYLKNHDNKYFTRREWIMEFTVYKDAITTIGPFTYYAYKPRSIKGEEIIYNFNHEAKVNGSPLNIFCEEDDIGKDGKRVLLRSKIPLRAGDNVYLKLGYDVFGENALCQEELSKYLAEPTLKNILRNNLLKKMNCEAVFMNPAYAKDYQIKVSFPENYPWKPLDNLDDQFDIVLGYTPLNKERLKHIIRLEIDSNCIILKYKHKFPPSSHWAFIYWKLPTKPELISKGYIPYHQA